MKNHYLAMLGSSLILGISFIIGCLIISSERAESSDKAVQAAVAQTQIEAEAQSELLVKIKSEGKEVLNIQEAAQLLGLEEDQIINVIKAENAILSNNGIFTGHMLPFFKVDNEFKFSREELMEWVYVVTEQNRIYRADKIIK
ncbi:hypothetical protein [Paenibacillus sp. FSL R7-0331]|uniref:hypothetical protein n=1 Tax=Paenibacillus sp. FSL R7-0331 TaxID=1536773 RepID=UPI0004F61E3C|nr:hypothetical protein [Paenibacillus sp. FSL R7-0331]AIQ52261.1 hypothetical protein R70331_12595 [Paenibacillus sp. FSL R7-0331]